MQHLPTPASSFSRQAEEMYFSISMGLPSGSAVKNPSANARDAGWILSQEDKLKEEVATHSSILAWEIPWTEELGGLQSIGLQRVGHN